MADYNASAPLLTRLRRESDQTPISQSWTDARAGFETWVRDMRARGRRKLASGTLHYFLMSLVALNVALLLLKVFLQLIACEMHQIKEPWVMGTRESLETVGIIFSVLFVLELVASVASFGFSYFYLSFHVFDAAVILLSFAINVGTSGTLRSIGSLIIVLRLWRLSKMSEDMILGAAERIGGLEQRNEELSEEVKRLREELGLTHTTEFSEV